MRRGTKHSQASKLKMSASQRYTWQENQLAHVAAMQRLRREMVKDANADGAIAAIRGGVRGSGRGVGLARG